MDVSITPEKLRVARDGPDAPLVIDVRRVKAFTEASYTIPGALRREPESVQTWVAHLPPAARVVVYCVHGHEVSQTAAAALRSQGLDACFLDHGIEGWREAGGDLQPKPAGGATRWVTRARPRIDRIACPWLISRFIDQAAEFLYVPESEVRAVAAERNAVAFDIPEVEFGHTGSRCSFDAFIARYRLGANAALARLADIVRAADTGRPQDAAQAPGLLALSIGLSRLYADDHAMLAQGMIMYDAFYRWCEAG